MLRRLMKYEIHSTARIFLPLYLVLFLTAILNKVFLSINAEQLGIPLVISMTAYVGIVVAIFVMTLVVTIQRFYKNLLTDEGYLMFTLPVSVDSQIISKMLIASLWNFISFVISIFSVFVLAADENAMQNLAIAIQQFKVFLAMQGSQIYLILFQFVLLMILSLFVGVLNLYVSMAIGQLVSKHRVAGSLGAFFLISLVGQIVITVLVNVGANHGWFAIFDQIQPLSAMHLLLGLMNVALLILGAAFYFGTRYILKNKLNLE